MVILARDISATVAAQRKQDFLDGLLAQVFASVDEAVVIADGNSRILLANPHIARLLGYRSAELAGVDTLVVVAPRAREQIARLSRQQIEQGGTMSYNVPLIKADGSELLCRVTSTVVEREELKRFRILTIRPAADATLTRETETAGQIKRVGLDEVRATLGPGWKPAAERAMATAEAIIKRRCGLKDIYARMDDSTSS